MGYLPNYPMIVFFHSVFISGEWRSLHGESKRCKGVNGIVQVPMIYSKLPSLFVFVT